MGVARLLTPYSPSGSVATRCCSLLDDTSHISMKEVDPMIFYAAYKHMHEARFVHTPENEIGYAVYITLHKHTVWGRDGAIFHMSTD